MKHTLSGLRNIINNTRGKTRKEIILAIKAWEIQNREELQQLRSKALKHENFLTDRAIAGFIDELLGEPTK